MAFAPLDWLGNIGGKTYDWIGDNPLQAGNLALGAFGTGSGIYDAFIANKQIENRRKLAEQFSRLGPTAFNPNWSPQQLQAMYFRPAAQFMAGNGITDGGAFRGALADAALKAESDRNQLGNQIFQSRLAALGYGPTRQPTGNVGGFAGALQNLMLARSLQGRPYGNLAQGGGAGQPGATLNFGTANTGYAPDWSLAPDTYDYSIPGMGLQGGAGMAPWASNMTMSNGLNNFYPDESLGYGKGLQ